VRVFPDTHVLASALMAHGLCRDLLDLGAVRGMPILSPRETWMRLFQRESPR